MSYTKAKFRTLLICTAGAGIIASSMVANAQDASNSATITIPSGAFDPNLGNNSASDIDTIFAAIVATNDSASGISSVTGGTAVLNAFTGDTFNGGAASTANSTLSVAPGHSVPAGLTFNTSTGDVDVAAGTPGGTYTFDYQICETANPTNCETATITVDVDSSVIAATPDNPAPADGANGADDIINVFDNDTLNGVAVNPADITATVTTPATPASPGDPVPVMDTATGLVDVPANTPAGTYTIAYQICETIDPTNCANTVATIVVFPTHDLSITKTNTPGVNGEVDQASDTLTSGTNTTYTLTVTNNGPDIASGAVVSDNPVSGLTCPAGNAVTISGSGVPVGSFTIGDLTGAGITLGTLNAGESTVLTFSCQVN